MAKTYGSELLQGTAVSSFWNGFLNFPDPFADLISRRDSVQSTDTYTWLGSAPMPEDTAGASAEVKSANEYSYTAKNIHYKAAVRVAARLIKYEQWDEIGNLLSNMGAKAAAHQAKLATLLLEAGFATTTYDSQFFFDIDHSDPGAEYTTSQDNFTTTNITDPAAPTAAEANTALEDHFSTMLGWKDDRGDPFSPSLTHTPGTTVVMIPPGYWSSFHQILTAETLAAAGDNALQGTFELRVNPFATQTDHFYSFWKNVPHKPIIVQETGGVMLENNMGADENVLTGDVIYTATWWGKVQYGQWRTAHGQTFT